MSKAMSKAKKEVSKNSANVFYIPDDYLVHVTVDDVKGFPEFSFEYKPMNIGQVSCFSDKILESKTTDEAIKLNLGIIQGHVKSWTMTKPDGSEIDFTDINELKKLHPEIANRIVEEIRGGTGSVEDITEAKEQVKNL